MSGRRPPQHSQAGSTVLHSDAWLEARLTFPETGRPYSDVDAYWNAAPARTVPTRFKVPTAIRPIAPCRQEQAGTERKGTVGRTQERMRYRHPCRRMPCLTCRRRYRSQGSEAAYIGLKGRPFSAPATAGSPAIPQALSVCSVWQGASLFSTERRQQGPMVQEQPFEHTLLRAKKSAGK